jgi:hypothetical protein
LNLPANAVRALCARTIDMLHAWFAHRYRGDTTRRNANMRRCTRIAGMLLLGVASPALALEKCPSETRETAKIIKAIRSAPACIESFHVMKDCRSHADSDARLAEVVIERCEATFLPHMSPDRQYVYRRARDVCARKFANRPGALYASYQATCEAAVAARYGWWGGD